jgi:hypothetical protein
MGATRLALEMNLAGASYGTISAMNAWRLRSFVSGVGGVLCLLVTLLCVRSYWRADALYVTVGGDNTGIESRHGRLLPFFQQHGGSGHGWRVTTSTIHEGVVHYVHTPFSARNDWPSYAWVCVPHWFVAVLMGMLAAAPWLRWRRFSIRTMLIATAVFAILLGIAVLHHRLGGME